MASVQLLCVSQLPCDSTFSYVQSSAASTSTVNGFSSFSSERANNDVPSRLVNDWVFCRPADHKSDCVILTWRSNASLSTVDGDDNRVQSYTFRCGVFHGPMLKWEHPGQSLMILSPSAEARLRASSSLSEEQMRDGSAWTSMFVDRVDEAEAVVFAVTEDSVGNQFDPALLLEQYVAPHFLDVCRAVAVHEVLYLPNRSRSLASTPGAAHSRLITVVQLDASGRGCGVLGDTTRMHVVQVCRRPQRNSSLSQLPVVPHTSNRTTVWDISTPHANYRRSVSQPQQREPLLPSPPHTQRVPSTSADSLALLLLREDEKDAADIKEQEIQRIIREWSVTESRFASEQVLVPVVRSLRNGAGSASENDYSAADEESEVTEGVRRLYATSNTLNAMHEDVIRFLRDRVAHPSRGNVIRFELRGDGVSTRHLLTEMNRHDVEEGLQRYLREHCAIVCLGTFSTFDISIVYITIAPSCVETLEEMMQAGASSGQACLSVSVAVGGFDSTSIDTGNNRVTQWTGHRSQISIVEDLCKRREQHRGDWNRMVLRLQPLEQCSVSIGRHVMELDRLYLALCSQMCIAPKAWTGTDSVGIEGVDFSAPSPPPDASSLEIIPLHGMMNLMHQIHRLGDDVKRHALGNATTSTPDEDTLNHPPSPSQSTVSLQPHYAEKAAQLLHVLDSEYATIRKAMSELFLSGDPHRARGLWQQRAVEQQRRLAVLARMESRLHVYGSILLPCAQRYFSLVAPSIGLATDYRASAELFRFLQASLRAQKEKKQTPLVVEEEVATFRQLVAAVNTIPRIPAFRLSF